MIRRTWHLNTGIENALDIALSYANLTGEKAQVDFDGFSVVVSPEQELEDVLADYYTQKAAINNQATSSQ